MAFKTLKQGEKLDNAVVVDNSVMMRWLFQDGAHDDQVYAQKVLKAIGVKALQVIVPCIWVYESAFVAEYYARRDKLDYDQCGEQLIWLFNLCTVIRGDETPTSLYEFSQAQRLSAYDAGYAKLALDHSCPIATLDKALVKASSKARYRLFKP